MEGNTRTLPVITLAEALQEAGVGFDASVLSGGDAARVVEVMAATEKACALIRARSAVR